MTVERDAGEVTELLARVASGDHVATAELYAVLYESLRALAGRFVGAERAGHILSPTALVHEVYLKFSGQNVGPWNDRAHFLAVAARAMRQVLIDHARRQRAAKRGPQHQRLTTGIEEVFADRNAEVDVIALDDVLRRLERLNTRHARVVELRVFAGLSSAEAAQVLGISTRTVDSDWRFASAWLRKELQA